jgi:hypothetical protein
MSAAVQPHPESGASAGGIRLPIACANATPPRAAQGNRAPAATESRAQVHAAGARTEHGEDGEDATLPAASTEAFSGARGATFHHGSTLFHFLLSSNTFRCPLSRSRGTSTSARIL